MLPKIIKKHISVLHSEKLNTQKKTFQLKTLFPKDCFSIIYKRNKNLKELNAPSIYPKKMFTRTSSIASCNNCDICKNYMIFEKTFICTITDKLYFIRGQLNCESINVVNLITCSKCLKQYLSSAVKFKTRFCIHKSDIKTKKERCGRARHFNSKCYHDSNPFQYLQVQFFEQVHSNSLKNVKDILWERKSTGSPSYLP